MHSRLTQGVRLLPPGLLPLLSPLLLLPLLLPAGCRALEGKRRRGSTSKG